MKKTKSSKKIVLKITMSMTPIRRRHILVPPLIQVTKASNASDPSLIVHGQLCQSHSTLRLPTCCERLLALSNPCWTLPVGCSLVHRGQVESTINLYPAKGKVMAMSAATTSLE